MSYEFGCIIDCRKDPNIKHFVLSFGIDRKDRVMYCVITSRIYRAFEKLCIFFNANCINTKCRNQHFEHEFKERSKVGEKIIIPVNLSDVFFLSKKSYPLRLTDDSMIIINSDPITKDVSAFNQLKKGGFILEVDRLSVVDKRRLYAHIKTSSNISPDVLSSIGQNFNKLEIK